MKSLFIAVLILVLCTVIIVGCAKPAPAPKLTPASSPASTPAAATPKPQYGGTLKIISSVSALNIGAPTETSMPRDQVYAGPSVESLLRMDETGLLVPWLATGWQVGPDLKSIILPLRKGVKFHDGTDFNAAVVKYCLDAQRASAKPELKQVSSIDVVDDYTVRLNLSRFEGQQLISLAFRLGQMISPTAAKANSKEWLMTNPVGTGPFKLASYKKDVSIKYGKFDGYWQKGKPYLDGIEINFVADPVTALISFKAGEAQAFLGIGPKDASDLQTTGKYSITKTPSNVLGIAGDSANPKSMFADIKVRRAVEYAIDKGTIAKGLGYGFYQAANQPGVPGTWAYNPAVAGYPYEPKKAKELLTQAGYPNGFTTSIIFADVSLKDMFTVVQSHLSQVGIDAKLEIVTNPAYVQTHTKGWQNSLIQNTIPASVGYDQVNALLRMLSSKGEGYASIIHPVDYEAKLDQALVENDFDKRKTLFYEMMKLVIDEYCMMNPIYLSNSICAKAPEVHDLRMYEYWVNQWTPADAWLSK